jgi:hypothetical protein
MFPEVKALIGHFKFEKLAVKGTLFYRQRVRRRCPQQTEAAIPREGSGHNALWM